MRQLPVGFPDRQPAVSASSGAVLALAILGLALFGCRTTDASGNLASVTIKNRSLDPICSATEAVFREHGYQGGRTGLADLRFEKPGSAADNLAYGTWFGGTVTVKVAVTLRGKGDGTVVLGCTVQLVENANDPFFESKHKVRKVRRATFQKLLDEVRDRLK